MLVTIMTTKSNDEIQEIKEEYKKRKFHVKVSNKYAMTTDPKFHPQNQNGK